jgi:hypothetical protein
MILHGHIKQCENLSFPFGQAKNFRMFLVMGQSKWQLQKEKKKKKTCALGFVTSN